MTTVEWGGTNVPLYTKDQAAGHRPAACVSGGPDGLSVASCIVRLLNG